MNATATTLLSLDELRATVRPVCESHAVLRLDLFGSRAQGTANADSDVDLLVEFSPESNPGLFEMGALQDALERRLGRRVDLLSRRAVEKSRNVFAAAQFWPVRWRFMLDNRQAGLLSDVLDSARSIRP